MKDSSMSRHGFLKSSLALTGLTLAVFVSPPGYRLLNASETKPGSNDFRSRSNAMTTEEKTNRPGLKSRCASCKWRNYAERTPNSLIARIWRWHTGWCPGWKAYQRELAEQNKS